MAHWELETAGTLGDAYEGMPVEYPRSDINRGQVSNSNKGAASRTDIVLDAVAMNDTGNVNVPRRDATVNYAAGPYPVIDDADEGVDENDGGTA